MITTEKVGIVHCTYGSGHALLSGIHFEYDPNDMEEMDYPKDFVDVLLPYNQNRLTLARSLLQEMGLAVK